MNNEEIKKLSNENPEEFLNIMTTVLQQVVDEKNQENELGQENRIEEGKRKKKRK